MGDQYSMNMNLREKKAASLSGFVMLGVICLALILSVVLFVMAVARLSSVGGAWGVILLIISIVLFALVFIGFFGFRVIKPNEALVLTLFGVYYGTLKGEGFYYVNPFVSAVNPGSNGDDVLAILSEDKETGKNKKTVGMSNKKMSLKTMTLTNQHQKINDVNGNPIIIGIVVIWRITNTAKAAFNVDHYVDYLSTQTDSALRNTVRLYPYDGFDSDVEYSLIGSTQEVANRIKEEIQSKVDVAGIEVLEARITHLAYAPEIASAMLQRQQARAIVDARAMIVDGAVGMVEMALTELEKTSIVELDEERKAAMVSNLLVVLCGNHDAQPIVNSGSLY